MRAALIVGMNKLDRGGHMNRTILAWYDEGDGTGDTICLGDLISWPIYFSAINAGGAMDTMILMLDPFQHAIDGVLNEMP